MIIALLVPLILLAAPMAQAAPFPAFAFRPLGDSALGLDGFRETLSPGDIDGDGDPDFYSGQGRGGKQWWYENRGGGDFRPRLVSDANDADVGAAAADVDGDGDLDRLAGGYLYRNLGRVPGRPDSVAFRTERTGAPEYTHDLLAGDIDGDGRPDLAVVDFGHIEWRRNPGVTGGEWPPTQVYKVGTETQHGGLGLGDFDGDGDLDVSRLNLWWENRDSGQTWVQRPGPDFGQDDPGMYGLSGRVVAADADGDGDVDLFQSECDVRNGRVAWFENRDRGGSWVAHPIKDSTDRQDFHSLALADFDGDGDRDVFACGAGRTGVSSRWYVWENLDGKAGSFAEHVIHADSGYGGHDAAVFDADGDGDMDILSKAFQLSHSLVENRRIVITSVRPLARPRSAGKAALRRPVFGTPEGLRDALGRPR